MNIWTTTEGVYLTWEPNAKTLDQKTYMRTEISRMFEFIAAEKDYEEHLNAVLSEKENQMICMNLLTSLQLFRNQEDQYLIMKDRNQNKVVYSTSHGVVFVPKCVNVKEIDVLENQDKCYFDVPVTFELEKQNHTGFLNDLGIIRKVGKTVDCEDFHSLTRLHENRIVIERTKRSSNQKASSSKSNHP